MLLRSALVFLFWAGIVSAACDPNRVEIRGDFGEARFSVEIADDAEERARGLMFRENLPTSSGMLFLYPNTTRLSFWMRNTMIELDLLFVDDLGVIQHIHNRAQPFDETPIPGPPGRVVLEINGGLVERLGIQPGDEMRHPFFADGPAIWPC